jgi:predicted nucleotidyltransferase
MNHQVQFDPIRLEQCARRWRIRRLEAFGSCLRRDFNAQSDIDLLVTFADGTKWDLLDMVSLGEELEAIFGRPVDLVENGCIKNPFRLQTILPDLEVLYAA